MDIYIYILYIMIFLDIMFYHDLIFLMFYDNLLVDIPIDQPFFAGPTMSFTSQSPNVC